MFETKHSATRAWLVVMLWLVGLSWPRAAAAQISPPGLGEAETASWGAMGLRQDLDAHRRRALMTYLGAGTVSHPHDVNPFQTPAIWVLNQELYDYFRPDLYYSLALSYRRQRRYDPEPPYGPAVPAVKQELRLYGRYAYKIDAGRLALVSALRPELRTFFGAGQGTEREVLAFRFRFKTQATAQIDQAGVHRAVLSAELLADTARDHGGDWSAFGYRESRFCLYYSMHPAALSMSVDLGYMNDVLGTGSALVDVHYLAVDIIWHNPFSALACRLHHERSADDC